MNLEKVFLQNKAKKNVLRKYNFIINTGDNMTLVDRKKKISENNKLVIYYRNISKVWAFIDGS
jgi:hypothetical protein